MTISRFGGWLGALAMVVAGCAMDTGATGETDETLSRRRTCGGIAGTACPDGFVCVDDRRDSCDPMNGGADCGGICRRAHRTRCDYGDPSRTYVSRDPDQCATIRFACESGNAFFDECGCGCESVCLSTAFCVEGYQWDEASCSCVAGGQACGANVCRAGDVCCNASCGICTPPDGFCTQQVCDSTTPL